MCFAGLLLSIKYLKISGCAVFSQSLTANTTASNNTAVGASALSANTTGASGTAVGFDALKAVTTGGENTAVGRSAGEALTTGIRNVAIGPYSIYTATTQNYNAAGELIGTTIITNTFTNERQVDTTRLNLSSKKI
jgi:hypothetical protein